VPTIAERIDTVLEIRDAVDGSSIHQLTAAEREDRVESGFMSATAGL
jgi:exonuclease SbcC